MPNASLVLAPLVAGYAGFKETLAASGCRACGLWRGRTHIVVDRGNPAAKILVIGEAPGATEDKEARAFVGRAGKTLDRHMAAAGLDTNKDVLIANVVKCRPPENRRPTPAEARTCLPYLRRQIELMAPRLVVLLGNTALRHLAPERAGLSMKEAAGNWFRLPGVPDAEAIVFYHPAALLYNRRLEADMAAHVQLLRTKLIAGATP